MPKRKPIITIYMLDDKTIEIDGPLSNKPLTIDLLSKAIQMVVRFNPDSEKTKMEEFKKKLMI